MGCLEEINIIRYSINSLYIRWPWLNWLTVYFFGMTYNFAIRCLIFSDIFELNHGQLGDDTVLLRYLAMWLGSMEDWVLASYMLGILWGFDCSINYITFSHDSSRRGLVDCFKRPQNLSVGSFVLMIIKRVLRFSFFMAIFCAFGGLSTADVIFILTRQYRFTVDWIAMYYQDPEARKLVWISPEEYAIINASVLRLVLWGLSFALVSVAWVDLAIWNPLHLFFESLRMGPNEEKTTGIYSTEEGDQIVIIELGESNGGRHRNKSRSHSQYERQLSTNNGRPKDVNLTRQNSEYPGSGKRGLDEAERTRILGAGVGFVFVWLVLFPFVIHMIARMLPFCEAAIALNTSLNEMYRIVVGSEFLPAQPDGEITAITPENYYIHSPTEDFELFAEDSLYRTTKGFKGKKAFEVEVDPDDPPNVLILTVESFRHRDSKLLVGDNLYLMGGDEWLSATPEFDKWAGRNIAFTNFWSSYRTSRSLESILYGQPVYDSITASGTTGGRNDTELSGLPQLFKMKGYETTFTCGCRIDYDQWDEFLPTHGFEEFIVKDQFMERCEKDLGIKPEAWKAERRAMDFWGVHDDLSFEVLANILTNKTDEQKARMKRGEPKKPFFMDHYTITSHIPFWEHPQWWDWAWKPDFTSIIPWQTQGYNGDTHRYLDLRYFQDLHFGKFMNRLNESGILNDTIIFIVGDHGMGPENLAKFETLQQSTTHVGAALIAEGRLGKYAGSLIHDAAEQYDIMATLADIVGLPKGGFPNTGIGRSLLREVPFGERIVWSTNPTMKMAAIRGHERIVFDRQGDLIQVFNSSTDHNQLNDLYQWMDESKRAELDKIRLAGRQINRYFKKRWEKKCLVKASCD